MEKKITHYPDVSVLVTHYNRSRSLENLLKSLQGISCSFGEIVVSDDGSKPEHLEYIKNLQQQYTFRLITTPVNKGLGNNLNKGQDAVKTPYTIYIQEDFQPRANFPEHFKDAFEIMEEQKDIDLVRFYGYLKYPYLKPFGKGYSEAIYKLWYPDYMKIYAYSDHPHLRRSNFLEKFGRYNEKVKGERPEYHMCIAFIQNKGRALIYDDYQSLFDQRNSSAEPSSFVRSVWTRNKSFFITTLRNGYRMMKYNFDILFLRRQ